MSENTSAAEWLRGIIGRYEDDRAQSCSGMAKMFGIYCEHIASCRDCMIKMMTAIVDRIERPKAKREDAGNYWLCGHCGAFSRKDAVTDCFGVIPSRCCGNCGREWER